MGKINEIYDFSGQNGGYPDSPLMPSNDAILVALELPGQRKWQIQESLKELRALAESLSFTIKKTVINRREKPSASYLIGTGTIEQLKAYCHEHHVKTIIFDDDLSPAQIKNIMKLLGDDVRPMDRTELIIDIFAQRAKTKEGKLQIELARLEYVLPRLTRQWVHLMHQAGMTGGSVGVRGPGEKQLEMDRRQIRHRITTIKKDLKKIEKYRSVQRKKRKRNNVPVMAIIGYTNAGKSTLLNALTNANAQVEDKLFATLDPTSRKFTIPSKNQDIVLTDTVGFIKKLPHELVDAFKATLEEVRFADVLLHVLDASDELAETKCKVVHQVLKELGADDKYVVTLLNKVDQVSDMTLVYDLRKAHEPAVCISARTGEGFNNLFRLLDKVTASYRMKAELCLPYHEQKLLSQLYERGTILSRRDEEDGIYITVECDALLEQKIENYLID